MVHGDWCSLISETIASGCIKPGKLEKLSKQIEVFLEKNHRTHSSRPYVWWPDSTQKPWLKYDETTQGWRRTPMNFAWQSTSITIPRGFRMSEKSAAQVMSSLSKVHEKLHPQWFEKWLVCYSEPSIFFNHMVASWNGATPKWLVYKGKSH